MADTEARIVVDASPNSLEMIVNSAQSVLPGQIAPNARPPSPGKVAGRVCHLGVEKSVMNARIGDPVRIAVIVPIRLLGRRVHNVSHLILAPTAKTARME